MITLTAEQREAAERGPITVECAGPGCRRRFSIALTSSARRSGRIRERFCDGCCPKPAKERNHGVFGDKGAINQIVAAKARELGADGDA